MMLRWVFSLTNLLFALSLVIGVQASAAYVADAGSQTVTAAAKLEACNPIDDDVPTESGKALCHCHCSCHVHQMGMPASDTLALFDLQTGTPKSFGGGADRPSISSGSDLRPPIA